MQWAGKDVPKATIMRLSLYLRRLRKLSREGAETVSSRQLADAFGLTDAQVRRDIAYFGQFGYPGIGYRVGELAERIRMILGTNRRWQVALVGVGSLGRALLGHRGFALKGFHIVAAFDVDPAKAGKEIYSVRVYDMTHLERVIRERGIQIAVICTPADVAQNVADKLAGARIGAILNFAPVTLDVPDTVVLNSVDLAIQLEQLSFQLARR